MPAEFDIIKVFGLAHAEDADHLMLAAIEGALPRIDF